MKSLAEMDCNKPLVKIGDVRLNAMSQVKNTVRLQRLVEVKTVWLGEILSLIPRHKSRPPALEACRQESPPIMVEAELRNLEKIPCCFGMCIPTDELKRAKQQKVFKKFSWWN